MDVNVNTKIDYQTIAVLAVVILAVGVTLIFISRMAK